VKTTRNAFHQNLCVMVKLTVEIKKTNSTVQLKQILVLETFPRVLGQGTVSTNSFFVIKSEMVVMERMNLDAKQISSPLLHQMVQEPPQLHVTLMSSVVSNPKLKNAFFGNTCAKVKKIAGTTTTNQTVLCMPENAMKTKFHVKAWNRLSAFTRSSCVMETMIAETTLTKKIVTGILLHFRSISFRATNYATESVSGRTWYATV